MRKLISTVLLCLISFNVQAQTPQVIYITIPILADNPIYSSEAFALDYEVVTGEVWVMGNIKDQDGIVQMMGSWIATEAQMIELKSSWPMMSWHRSYSIYPQGFTQGFTQKVDPELGN
ncbi:MAG: hypothetical protein ACUZ8H_05470 [Candidatus Anammoxibacter sp.]